jgi:hypothetical protein
MAKRGGALAVVLLLVVGCGGDDDGGGDGGGADAATGGADAREQADAASGACAEAPSGTVNGTVDAETIDPIAAAYSRPHPTLGYAHILQIDEDPASSCDNPDGDTGESLQFIFCDPPSVGEYDVVGADDFPVEACPGERVVGAQVQSGNGADRGIGDSGTLTIESIDTCLTASFTVGFNTGNLDGDVVAEVCP